MKKNSMTKDKTYSMRPALGHKAPVSGALIATAGSLLMALVLEMLSRRSILAAFAFIGKNPAAFVLDWAIVAFSFCLALLPRKKVFSMTLICVVWLGFGIADWLVMVHRTANPLSAADLQLNMAAILIAPVYYSWWQLMLGGILIVGLVIGMVFLAVKTPRYRKETKKGLVRLCVSATVLAFGVLFCLGQGYVSATLRPSLYDAYMDYGFPYCFVYSFFDNGVQPKNYTDEAVKEIGEEIDIKVETDGEEEESLNMADRFRQFISSTLFSDTPEGYTAEAVETIKNLIQSEDGAGEETLPNVIFIQLESFFDPTKLTNYTLASDPIPNFRALTETCSTGKLYVPTVSGGTANTEFEVLTGCNLDFFGAGEFPYYSVLRETVSESLATDLKTAGMTATFLHDFTGSYYYRNEVYSNLCFDRFVSLEYMTDYELTQHNWAKDEVLVKYIMDSLTTTDTRDFIYTITVQTHGSYTPAAEYTPAVEVLSAPGEREKEEMEYYLTQMADEDAFIGELVKQLSSYPEDTVLVLYGDHLPGIEFEVSDLSDGELYATPYVIWSNFDLEKQDEDVEAYQLGAYVMSRIGMNSGVMVRFHQTQSDTADYMENLLLLQYDLMYGEHYMYGGATLTRSGEMCFGLSDITADSAVNRDGNLFVTGSGFTEASKVFVNGSKQDTIFVSDSILVVADEEIEADDTVSVGQVCEDLTVLSEVQAGENK